MYQFDLMQSDEELRKEAKRLGKIVGKRVKRLQEAGYAESSYQLEKLEAMRASYKPPRVKITSAGLKGTPTSVLRKEISDYENFLNSPETTLSGIKKEMKKASQILNKDINEITFRELSRKYDAINAIKDTFGSDVVNRLYYGVKKEYGEKASQDLTYKLSDFFHNKNENDVMYLDELFEIAGVEM